jgi:pyridoxal phosphate enzyme (YggS family)
MKISQRLFNLKTSLPPNVTLVAVSKLHPVEVLQEAYDAGQRIFGENRVQELSAKYPLLPSDIQWHFVGTLQKNKVKVIAPFIDTIQSIDSLNLLKEVNKQASKCNRRIRVFLEVHIAEEMTKHGFALDECLRLFLDNKLNAYPHVIIAGLMGMATFTDDTEQIQHEFHALKELFDKIKFSGKAGDSFTELSMGMSDDYPLAIQNGSTMIRVGTLIFGERKYELKNEL